ncbi:sensor histidine kinase [Pedobacter cryotolerans]|uniref:histidine kinase n=1 Tax=Pedobacter cryotolerans TaxID=2571270 RepID=A0A4U1CBJ8_9SPHI|nr:HAMP domain-containing sensor histidine kinase [Pedobacter cryotolerans]TKC03318.1 HAMP domain-containing histidine kinase [Pedobacter cryotolerans]
MKKKSLWLITALMTLALLGVFVMQLYYIKESYKLKSQLFEQNVNQALNAVVNKVQKRNVAKHINKKDDEFKAQKENGIRSQMDTIVAFRVKFKENENLRKYRQQQQIINYLNSQDSIIRSNYLQPQIISEETFKLYNNPNTDYASKPTLDVVDVRDPLTGKLLGRRVNPRKVKTPQLQMDNLPDTIRYLVYSMVDGMPLFISLPSTEPDLISKFKVEDAKAKLKYEMQLSRLYADTVVVLNENINLVRDVAKEMNNSDLPLAQRVPDIESLDTLIKAELLSRGITLAYDFLITSVKNTNNVIYRRVSNSNIDPIAENTYSHVLFSNDVAAKDPGMIYLRLPNKNAAIFSNMFVTLASSVGLLLVLISIFAYTIYAIIRQKKLSEMKTDFINNMTHEFKTPVATIMIASEALKDPEVVEDKSRISRLANIIYDENVRLGNHIERVLSVARLERKEIKLEFAAVNVNDLVTAVVDSMGLQLQKRNAAVTLNLDATQDLIMADELHLSNVIYNLIDNANKYSLDSPHIDIATSNRGKNLIIEVADKGIGMTKEQTKRIFDQFYRVPTGNLHDVKGFGLGLNYVRDIVAEMDGTIKVNSEKDKGTTFEISLPIKHTNN